MRAHRIYNENTRNRGANRTLIFNVLRYLTRQAILRAARNDPLSIEDRRIRFSPDKLLTQLVLQIWNFSYFIRPL